MEEANSKTTPPAVNAITEFMKRLICDRQGAEMILVTDRSHSHSISRRKHENQELERTLHKELRWSPSVASGRIHSSLPHHWHDIPHIDIIRE